jgi:hypothetical protein
VLCDVSGQLRHLDLFLQVALEACIDDFALARLEPVDDGGNGAYIVLIGEMYEFLVDEFLVPYALPIVNHRHIGVVSAEPLLPPIRILFGEHQFQCLRVLGVHVLKFDSVSLEVLEVLLRFLVSRCTQPFVVLYFPTLEVKYRLTPQLEILHREEGDRIASLARFEQWCDELFEEVGGFEERGPEELNEVYHQPFDVGAVGVLV